MFGIPESVVLPVVGSVPVWALTGLVAVLFFTGMLRKYGIKKKKDVATIAAIATAVLLLGAPATVTPGVGLVDAECLSTTTPDVDPNFYDKYSPGTAITEAATSYRELGTTGPWTGTAGGTELTGLEVGKTFEYISGTSTTDHTSNAWAKYLTFTVKCLEDEVLSNEAVNDEDAAGLTSTFYNGDGVATTAVPITTSESKSFELKYQAGSNEVYGDPFTGSDTPNVLVLQLNGTDFNAPTNVYISKGRGQGTSLSAVACPTTVNGSAIYVNFCFRAPWVDESETRISVTVNAKAVDPSMAGSAYLLPGGPYVSDVDTQLYYGVEDEAGNPVGVTFANAEQTSIIFS